ncbi:MAG: TraR/DksA family transcriptional regulator [Desulfurivibrionaceae bacterium]
MASELTREELKEIEKGLRERLTELREEVRRELLATEEEHYIDLAGRVHDVGDSSTADLLADLNLVIKDTHVEEIQAIEDALERIRVMSYGNCLECGEPLRPERLKAYPTATRCYECQEKYERTHPVS